MLLELVIIIAFAVSPVFVSNLLKGMEMKNFYFCVLCVFLLFIESESSQTYNFYSDTSCSQLVLTVVVSECMAALVVDTNTGDTANAIIITSSNNICVYRDNSCQTELANCTVFTPAINCVVDSTSITINGIAIHSEQGSPSPSAGSTNDAATVAPAVIIPVVFILILCTVGYFWIRKRRNLVSSTSLKLDVVPNDNNNSNFNSNSFSNNSHKNNNGFNKPLMAVKVHNVQQSEVPKSQSFDQQPGAGSPPKMPPIVLPV